jgi:uncharacterized Zn finger protein
VSWGYRDYTYVSVASKRAKAQKELAKLRKKDPAVAPVVIEGRKLAKTWWGIAWNQNLESYADYSNRIGRGSSYVKNGMVLDLRIETGLISALVMGSGRTPYTVKIAVDPLPKAQWDHITRQCSQKIGGLTDLAEGKFPQELADLFLQQRNGLFPSPKEIHLSCSCPDWADMCKHVAAALYGVGARFDQDPLLFFKLRDIPFEALLKKSVEEKMGSLLKNAGKKTGRILEEDDIEGIFGIAQEKHG